MNMKTTLAATVAALTIGSGAAAQDLSFFLAEDGLSNPADVDSAAVNPARINPTVTTDGIASERLYIWALHAADDLNCNGLSFDFSTTGTLVVNDVVLYNLFAPVAGTAWTATINGAADGAGWSNASATAPIDDGLFSGFFQELGPGLDNIHVIDDVQLVGHIEVSGEGDIFFEVGQAGIIRDLFESLPGPQVGFGFGDATVSGSAYGTASSVADASLVIDECVGFAACGDYNGDTLINIADVVNHADTYHAPTNTVEEICVGDHNGDGLVNHFDNGVLFDALFNGAPFPTCD